MTLCLFLFKTFNQVGNLLLGIAYGIDIFYDKEVKLPFLQTNAEATSTILKNMLPVGMYSCNHLLNSICNIEM